jgi:hypothetical protein
MDGDFFFGSLTELSVVSGSLVASGPHDFDSPHLTLYGKVRRAVHTESRLAKRALDNVAHDITGNAWKLRAIVFFFFGWIERGGFLLQVFPIASRLHLAKHMESRALRNNFLFLEGRVPPRMCN